MYKVQVSNFIGVFSLPTTLSNVDTKNLLTIPNPRYADIIFKYQHLKGVEIDDTNIMPELSIHVILGASWCGFEKQIVTHFDFIG